MTDISQQSVLPPEIEPPAGSGLRFLAKLTDMMLVNAVEVIFGCAFAVLQAKGLSGIQLSIWFAVAIFVLIFAYFTILTSGGHSTLGRKLAGIRVVRDVPPGQASELGIGRALGRSIIDITCLMLVGNIVGLIDFLPVLFTRRKRALHDIAAKTRVIRIGSPRYGALVACVVGFLAVVVVGVFGIIKPFFIEAVYIPSPVMLPTLPVNSGLLLNKISYKLNTPRRGDILAFDIPDSAKSYFPQDHAENYIKRVVGVPGDELRLTGGHVYLWNAGHPQALDEPYVQNGFDGNVPEPHGEDGPDDWFLRRKSSLIQHGKDWWIKVPPGQYFVLGDNRNNSNDSHVWGFLPLSYITGKITMMYKPVIKDF